MILIFNTFLEYLKTIIWLSYFKIKIYILLYNKKELFLKNKLTCRNNRIPKLSDAIYTLFTLIYMH